MKKCILDCCSGGGGGEFQGVFLLNFTVWYRLIRNDTARQDKSANGLTSPCPAKVMFKLRHVNFKNFCLFIAVFFLLHSKNTFFSQLLSSSTPKFPSLDTAWFFLFFFVFLICFAKLSEISWCLLMNDLKFFAWPEGKAACSSKWLKTPCRCWWIKDLSSLWMAGSTFQSWYSHRTICVIPCCLSSWFLSWTDNGSFDLISNGWVLKRKTKNWFVFVFVCWLAYLVDWIPHVFWLFS